MRFHNPFDANESLLCRSLSTGLTVSHTMDVNCDEAEKVGYMILKVLGCLFRRSEN